MTAGRKPLSPAIQQGPDFVTATPPEIVAREQQAREILRGEDLVMQFEEVHRQIGQIESLEFMRHVADVATAQIFENMRNSGKYKGLPYKDADGNMRHVASLDEFCETKLGKSYRRCMDLSQNLRTLGPELYEQSERLGLRNIDYKALRALPAEEQAVVKQAIEGTQSREEVVALLQEMAIRHQQDRESLSTEMAVREAAILKAQADISGQLAAKDKVIAEKSARISTLVEEKNRTECLTDAEQAAEIERQLTEATLVAAGALIPVRKAVHAARSLDHCPQGLYIALQGAVDRIAGEAMSIAADYGIQLNLTAWMDSDPDAPLGDPNAGETIGPIFVPAE